MRLSSRCLLNQAALVKEARHTLWECRSPLHKAEHGAGLAAEPGFRLAHRSPNNPRVHKG